MKFGVVQPITPRRALELSSRALSEGAEVLLLPEKWVQNLEEAPLSEMRKLARDFSAFVIPGAFEDGVSVVAPIISPEGELRGISKKIFLFGNERERLMPGDRVAIFTARGVKIGVIICYDLDFPEVTRAMFSKGVEVILVPSRVKARGMPMWRKYMEVRSLENRVAVVNANAIDPPEFTGGSAAVVPVRKGEFVEPVYQQLLTEEEGYAVLEVDPLSYLKERMERLKELRQNLQVVEVSLNST